MLVARPRWLHACKCHYPTFIITLKEIHVRVRNENEWVREKFMFIKEYVHCTRSSVKARPNDYHIRGRMKVGVVFARERKRKKESRTENLQKKNNWLCHDSFMFCHADPKMYQSPVENPPQFDVQFQGQHFKKADFFTSFRFATFFQVHCCVLTSVTAICWKATWNKTHCTTIASQDHYM